MTQAMTATQAQTFTRKSLSSEMTLADAARERGCSCRPYVDWFTYRRWKAQGFQVQKGEHGVKLTTYIPVFKTDPVTGEKVPNGTRPRRTTVFCRCQTKPIESKGQKGSR